MPEQDAEILQLPQRQIARINGIRLNLRAMSDLELMVLESQVSDRFIEVHSELEVVRRALAERRSNDSSDDQLSPGHGAHPDKRCQLCPETGANYVVQPVTTGPTTRGVIVPFGCGRSKHSARRGVKIQCRSVQQKWRQRSTGCADRARDQINISPVRAATCRAAGRQLEQQPEAVAARTVENFEMGSGSQCSGGRQEPRPAAASSATQALTWERRDVDSAAFLQASTRQCPGRRNAHMWPLW